MGRSGNKDSSYETATVITAVVHLRHKEWGLGIYSGYILKVKGTGMRGRTQGWLRLDLKT